MMTPLWRSFALGAYSKLTRGSATDFPIPHKPNPPRFRSFHQATPALSPAVKSSVKAVPSVGERGQNLGKRLVDILHGVSLRAGELPLLQADDPVAERAGLVLQMGHVDRDDLGPLADGEQQLVHLAAGGFIERAERFVEQQDAR